MRVVDRVLRNTARQRAAAEPAVATRLRQVLVGVVGVRHRAHRRHALATDVALLARVQADDHHAAVTADDLHVGAGRTGDLATLARLHLHVVDDGANGHLAQLHRVARLHVGLLTGDHLVAHAQALRRNDVRDIGLASLVGAIIDQRDEGGAVRIIFDPLHGALDVPAATLEIDIAVALLVTARDTARRHMALVVAATGLALAFGQRLDRGALPERRTVDEDQAAAGRARRVIMLECHRLRSPSSRQWTDRP